jgi:hypothetical protein
MSWKVDKQKGINSGIRWNLFAAEKVNVMLKQTNV